jgi:hypothetical protein
VLIVLDAAEGFPAVNNMGDDGVGEFMNHFGKGAAGVLQNQNNATNRRIVRRVKREVNRSTLLSLSFE